MSFSSDVANLVANQLSRFVTLNRYQLAGQVGNLDFWVAQVRNALEVVDGYGVRFVRLSSAQEQYVATHDTKRFTLDAELRVSGAISTPLAPKRVPDRELQKSRRSLIEAVSRFLVRCRREELISDAEISTACMSLGIDVEAIRDGW